MRKPWPTVYDAVKRVLERAVAVFLLVVLSPVLALIAVCVRFTLGSPVVFWQMRAGRRGRLFRLAKFRTMSPAAQDLGAVAAAATDQERMTPFGRILRSTSLDELPQLWNIAAGQMSFVGPRPLFPEYLERYSARQARRHEVMPGLTGWAQVNGRNSASWEDRLAMDVWYVDHRSFGLDLRILLRTVGIILRREGVSSKDASTGEAFAPQRRHTEGDER